MNDHKRRYRQDPDVITTFLSSDEAVMVHADTKLSYSLNATGLRIWDLLKEDRTVDDLTEAIYSEFNVDRERARSGVIHFVEELLSFKLIVSEKEEEN